MKTFGTFEMNNRVVIFEEVDFVNSRNGLGSAFSQNVNELVVIGNGGFGDFFNLPVSWILLNTLRRATPLPPMRVESPNFSASFNLASCTASIKIIK